MVYTVAVPGHTDDLRVLNVHGSDFFFCRSEVFSTTLLAVPKIWFVEHFRVIPMAERWMHWGRATNGDTIEIPTIQSLVWDPQVNKQGVGAAALNPDGGCRYVSVMSHCIIRLLYLTFLTCADFGRVHNLERWWKGAYIVKRNTSRRIPRRRGDAARHSTWICLITVQSVGTPKPQPTCMGTGNNHTVAR